MAICPVLCGEKKEGMSQGVENRAPVSVPSALRDQNKRKGGHKEGSSLGEPGSPRYLLWFWRVVRLQTEIAPKRYPFQNETSYERRHETFLKFRSLPFAVDNFSQSPS